MMGRNSVDGYHLPVLNAVQDVVIKAGVPSFEKVVFICVQHFLYTSVELFEALIRLGTNPKNIFLLGKHYSMCEEVLKRLEQLGVQVQPLTPLTQLGQYADVFKKDISNMCKQMKKYIQRNQDNVEGIVVLDDGGRCLEHIAEVYFSFSVPVIGIEQTTAGLCNHERFCSIIPFIDVAASAAKVYLEPDMIIEALWSKIQEKLLSSKERPRCGIIGLGNIGKTLAVKLISLGYEVFIYDSNPVLAAVFTGRSVICCSSVSELIQESNFIFGCTGKDITIELKMFESFRGNKTLVSCSSEDKEFLTLLKNAPQLFEKVIYSEPLEDIKLYHQNENSVTILKGGFPINFDNTGVSACAEKIQLTRALLLSSIVQAFILLPKLAGSKTKGRVMLDPESQKFVAREWFKANSFVNSNFNDINWIIRKSQGTYLPLSLMSACFGFPERKPEEA